MARGESIAPAGLQEGEQYMCRNCGHCEVSDTVGLCGYWGFNVLLEDKCHHYTPLPDEARCRGCGNTWDGRTAGCYWVEEDLCGPCATKELNAALSGWHALSREISEEKKQAAPGRAKARAAGNA